MKLNKNIIGKIIFLLSVIGVGLLVWGILIKSKNINLSDALRSAGVIILLINLVFRYYYKRSLNQHSHTNTDN